MYFENPEMFFLGAFWSPKALYRHLTKLKKSEKVIFLGISKERLHEILLWNPKMKKNGKM